MNKLDKEIMVVERDILLGDQYFQGFREHNIYSSTTNNYDYESTILGNLKYMRRGNAEEDPAHKQPIGYILIVNSDIKKVFAYQRSKKDAEYTERRLHGKWSWGVGGHIEKSDLKDSNPIRSSMLRELEEEVEGVTNPNVAVLGYINDDLDEVGRVHFGILYAVETNSEEIKPKDAEIANGRFRSIQELEEICSSPECEVEGWSKIALEPLKSYFG